MIDVGALGSRLWRGFVAFAWGQGARRRIVISCLGGGLLLLALVISGTGSDSLSRIFGVGWKGALLTASVVGLATFATGIVGNIAASRLEAFIGKDLPEHPELFRNHHLAELTGACIRAIIRSTADRPAVRRDDKMIAYALSERAASEWQQLAVSLDPAALREYGGLVAPNLHQFVRNPRRPALDARAWHRFLDRLDGKDYRSRFRRQDLSGEIVDSLQREFGVAIREALKHDFVSGGEAFAAMQLDVAAELLQNSSVRVRGTEAADTLAKLKQCADAVLPVLQAIASEGSVAVIARFEVVSQRLDSLDRALNRFAAEQRTAHRSQRRLLIGISVAVGAVLMVAGGTLVIMLGSARAERARMARIEQFQKDFAASVIVLPGPSGATVRLTDVQSTLRKLVELDHDGTAMSRLVASVARFAVTQASDDAQRAESDLTLFRNQQVIGQYGSDRERLVGLLAESDLRVFEMKPCQAIETLEPASKLRPQDPAVTLRLTAALTMCRSSGLIQRQERATALLNKLLQTPEVAMADRAAAERQLCFVAAEEGQYKLAITHARAALDLEEGQPLDDQDKADRQIPLAVALRESGDLSSALTMLTAIGQSLQPAVEANEPAVVLYLRQMGQTLQLAGKGNEARELLDRAVRILRTRATANRKVLAFTLLDRSRVLVSLSKPDEAATDIEEAQAITRELNEGDVRWDAELLLAQAGAAWAKGDLAEAMRAARFAITLLEQSVGRDHPMVSAAYLTLAPMQRSAGLLPDAIASAKRALEISTNLLGPSHPSLIPIYFQLGIFEQEVGHDPAAAAQFERALALCKDEQTSKSWLQPRIQARLARVYLALNASDRAASTLAEAVQGLERSVDLPPGQRSQLMGDIGLVWLDLGIVAAQTKDDQLAAERFRSAEQLFTEAVEIDRAVWKDGHRIVGQGLLNLGMAQNYLGKGRDAMRSTREGLAILERQLPPTHPTVITGLGNLLLCGITAGDFEVAKRAGRTLLERHPARDDFAVMVHTELGQIALRERDFDTALGEYQAVLDIQQATLGPNNPAIRATVGVIEEIKRLRSAAAK